MSEREALEFDVLFVGAGPASLAGAYHLSQRIRQHNSAVAAGGKSGGREIEDISIAVIEKGKEVNSHSFSGAVLDPRALRELVPDFKERGAPVETPVSKDYIYYLTRSGKVAFPLIPAPMDNHGNYVVSIGKLVAWLAQECEKNDVNIFTETAGAELLFEGDAVVGVRSGDKGVDKQGNRRSNYEPGVELRAK